MNRTEYIIRQLAKTNKKSYENYVVTRIWHLLNNLDIKFITQQHVTRPTGRALTDMYFPQINLHVEINEAHHFNAEGNRILNDIIREADIINATGHELINIDISKAVEGKILVYDVSKINYQIDEVIKSIRQKFEEKKPSPWNIDAEYDPRTYIEKGEIMVSDNVAFRTIADACNCFGYNFHGFRKGYLRHAKEDRMLWFPKLYVNDDWENEISLNESHIFEKRIKNPNEYLENMGKGENDIKERLVFAKVKSNLGDVMYRFKGVYKWIPEESNKQGKIVYERVAESAKTYPSEKIN